MQAESSVRRVSLFLATMVATSALLIATAAPLFADYNGDKCNRGAHCYNWVIQPFPLPAICKDILGTTVPPTDAGCLGTVCTPCRTVGCTAPDGRAGMACACKLTMPLTPNALCQTCMGVDGTGNVLWIQCVDNGCVPVHDCDVAVPTGFGDAQCSCH